MTLTAKDFMEALKSSEASRDASPVASLFAPDAELSNLSMSKSGEDGAREFWRIYLEQFESIQSDFSQVIEADGNFALQWTSEGELKDGKSVKYRGVSLVQTEEGKVVKFDAYYDTTPFKS
ncbi:MAG: nuclear transport factor 2 family protein [Hyphomicrobiales bacterium]|nr:nuclear transport factor 2 family protein [Hyphomicrobiales bacterium]